MNANVDYIIKTAIGEFNYLDYEGQHITATNSIEGHARSAILKGQTLVNLCKLSGMNKPNPSREDVTDIPLHHLKENTQYTVIVNVLESSDTAITVGFLDTTGGSWEGVVRNISISSDMKMLITTGTGLGNKLRIHNNTSTGMLTVKNAIVLEGDYTNQDIPYFTGMQSVKMPVLKSVGKNLCDCDFELGSIGWDSGVKINSNTVVRNTTPIKVIGGDTIYITGKTKHAKDCKYIFEYDGNMNFIRRIQNDDGKALVLHEATRYINMRSSDQNVSGDDYVMLPLNEYKNVIMVSNTTTPYEPYKSNILTVNEPVELRGIGDVQDELDLLTGEVVERVGEYQITGEENWKFGPSRRRLEIHKPTFLPNIKCGAFASDILEAKQANDSSLHGTNGTYYIGYTSDGWIRIILGEDLSSLEQGIEWLKANRPTIQYQLKTESIKTVDLSDNHVYSYKDTTHYTCSSAEGSLVPTLSVKVPTDTQLTIQEQKATTQTLLIKNMDLQQSIKEVSYTHLRRRRWT